MHKTIAQEKTSTQFHPEAFLGLSNVWQRKSAGWRGNQGNVPEGIEILAWAWRKLHSPWKVKLLNLNRNGRDMPLNQTHKKCQPTQMWSISNVTLFSAPDWFNLIDSQFHKAAASQQYIPCFLLEFRTIAKESWKQWHPTSKSKAYPLHDAFSTQNSWNFDENEVTVLQSILWVNWAQNTREIRLTQAQYINQHQLNLLTELLK